MNDIKNQHPEQDPAEGSSEIIDRDLARQGDKRPLDDSKKAKQPVDPGSEAAEPSPE